MRSSFAKISPFTWKVAATLFTSLTVILLAYLSSSLKQPQNQHVVAEAQVRVAETSLLTSADPKSQPLLTLNRGVRLEILDRAPSPADRFVRAQPVWRRKGAPVGYILKDDLADWRSDDPEVAWGLIAALPQESGEDLKAYSANLRSYIEKFPGDAHSQDASARLQKVMQGNAPVPATVTSLEASRQPPPPLPPPAPPIQAVQQEKLKRLVDQLPALWEQGDLEDLVSVSGRVLSLDPANGEAKVWRSRAQKALRKLNDQ